MSIISSLAPNITELCYLLNSSYENDIENEIIIISELTRLETLKMDLIGNSVSKFLKTVIRKNPPIKNLAIIKGDFQEELSPLFKQLRFLETLEIIIPIGFTPKCFTELIETNLTLKALYLCELGTIIHFTQLKQLIAATPTLQLLKLNLWENELLNETKYLELVHLIKKRKNEKRLVIDLRNSLNYINVSRETLQKNSRQIRVLHHPKHDLNLTPTSQNIRNILDLGEINIV